MRIAIFIIIHFTVLLSGKLLSKEVRGNDPEWIKIGVTTISFTEENSELLVLKSEIYDSVKFKVTGSAIILEDLQFYFETGENQYVKVNFLIENGKESRTIELTGGERRLMKVGLNYKAPSGEKNSKSVVELWGSKKF